MDIFILFVAALAVFGIALVYPNIGLGGGFLHVPMLMFLVGLDKNIAVPLSLALVLAGALAALPRHYGAGCVDVKLAAKMSVGAVLGAVVGALFNLSINKELFQWLFAITIIVVCGRMVFDMYKGHGGETNDDSKMCRSRVGLAIAMSVLAGLLGSTFGIGGGLVYVPVLMYVLCRRTKLAVGTSTLIIVPTVAAGLITYFIGGSGNFDQDTIYYAAMFIPVALAGAFVGSKFCIEKLTNSNIKLLFISLAMVVAIGMIAMMLI